MKKRVTLKATKRATLNKLKKDPKSREVQSEFIVSEKAFMLQAVISPVVVQILV